MSVFQLLKDDTEAMKESILGFNPVQTSQEHQELINAYTTPKRSYITASARGVDLDDVSIENLEYIVVGCFKCTSKQKYEAIIVSLWKLYNKYKCTEKIESAKRELICHLEFTDNALVNDLTYIDTAIQGYERNFFYIIEITIGQNKILKYGITLNSPRTRFNQIRHDVKSHYGKQHIIITPLAIAYFEEVEVFEQRFKSSLLERDIGVTGYKFKGSSETFKIEHKVRLVELLGLCVEGFNYEVLYSIFD
jgi:hypothetical protein